LECGRWKSREVFKTPGKRVVISVLILARNEELNLPRCLKSVSWVDDIVVVDSFSTDGSKSVAEAAGARVLSRSFDTFSDQRNFGVLRGDLKNQWVLHLDADEEVSRELKTELIALAQTGEENAYRVPSKLIFQGRWLKYAGMYPSYQVRFGRKSVLRFHEVGHGQRETKESGSLGTVKNPLIHHNFSKGIADWIDRHNRYSTAEANFSLARTRSGTNVAGLFSFDGVERRRALKEISRRLPCRPLSRFLYMYLFRLGFLDGYPGYTYCRLLAMYEYMIVLKTKESRIDDTGFPG
jgi:glycosyltransferase involved in cell wall biosynthesis